MRKWIALSLVVATLGSAAPSFAVEFKPMCRCFCQGPNGEGNFEGFPRDTDNRRACFAHEGESCTYGYWWDRRKGILVNCGYAS